MYEISFFVALCSAIAVVAHLEVAFLCLITARLSLNSFSLCFLLASLTFLAFHNKISLLFADSCFGII